MSLIGRRLRVYQIRRAADSVPASGFDVV